MRTIVFKGNTWSKYEDLKAKDKILHKSRCNILKEMQLSDPGAGLGNPEALNHSLTGFWSRRLSQKDRLIYKYDDTAIYIFAVGGHYDM
jgi:toxin YoeB